MNMAQSSVSRQMEVLREYAGKRRFFLFSCEAGVLTQVRWNDSPYFFVPYFPPMKVDFRKDADGASEPYTVVRYMYACVKVEPYGWAYVDADYPGGPKKAATRVLIQYEGTLKIEAQARERIWQERVEEDHFMNSIVDGRLD